MDKMDEAIIGGIVPPEPQPDATPALAGYSYYWDCRAEGMDHRQACKRAARLMGASLASLASVGRGAGLS